MAPLGGLWLVWKGNNLPIAGWQSRSLCAWRGIPAFEACTKATASEPSVGREAPAPWGRFGWAVTALWLGRDLMQTPVDKR
ncbi:hypothetical protein NBRC116598_16660 [Pseudophaeobacter arcticus]|uniref:Uncharacterized protein n=1 Tax=Pseudophaeobacter arcticus TaxID=385492 RepID=A0ABQ0AK31_9RHOB